MILHVCVPELQQMWEEVQAAEQQVAAAAAAALDRIAQTFLGAYGVFRSLVGAVADLDVLAGFAQVCACCCRFVV
jgi:DNA mismatch repair ATPase MutS